MRTVWVALALFRGQYKLNIRGKTSGRNIYFIGLMMLFYIKGTSNSNDIKRGSAYFISHVVFPVEKRTRILNHVVSDWMVKHVSLNLSVLTTESRSF